MPRARRLHAAAIAVAVAASTLALTAGTGAASAQVGGARLDLDPAVPTSPTNAAKIFRWGSSAWEDEFILPLSESWAVSDPERVRNQNGMLTLEGAAGAGVVTSATVATHARRYGRWEARVRSDVRGDDTPYRVVWELVPGPGDRCGDGITLATYSVGDREADMDIRSRLGARFAEAASLDLDQYAWHTYAIEVTRDHISWFIDTKVVMTERSPEALSGRRLRMRFRLVPVEGERMGFTRMQMDWARYYTMERPGALPVDAPEAARSAFTSAC